MQQQNDLLLIASILKQIAWRCIIPEQPKTFQKTCIVPVGSVETEVFFSV